MTVNTNEKASLVRMPTDSPDNAGQAQLRQYIAWLRQTIEHHQAMQLSAVSVADWQMRHCWIAQGKAVAIRSPGSSDDLRIWEGEREPFGAMLYALCNAIVQERESCKPGWDAPARMQYESITHDVDAIAREHVRLADEYAQLTVYSREWATPHTERCRHQARLAVEDSIRRLLAFSQSPVRRESHGVLRNEPSAGPC